MRHTRLAAGLDGLAQSDVPGIAKLIELGHTVSHDSGSAVPSQLHAATVAAGYDIRPSTTRAREQEATPRSRRFGPVPAELYHRHMNNGKADTATLR